MHDRMVGLVEMMRMIADSFQLTAKNAGHFPYFCAMSRRGMTRGNEGQSPIRAMTAVSLRLTAYG